jgi:hypothetical protein
VQLGNASTAGWNARAVKTDIVARNTALEICLRELLLWIDDRAETSMLFRRAAKEEIWLRARALVHQETK